MRRAIGTSRKCTAPSAGGGYGTAVQRRRGRQRVPRVPLRLADGQLLLRMAGTDGALQLGEVRDGRLRLVLTNGDVEADLDSCSQVVLPWRPPAEGWAAMFLAKLAELKKNADTLKAEVQGLSVQEASEAKGTGHRAQGQGPGAGI